jgi:branched-chain amino acid aminotransferase
MDPTVIFLGDRFLETAEAARVSLFDRGYLLGDSVFETLRAYHAVAFRLRAHLGRLKHSAEVVGIRIPRKSEEIAKVVQEGLRRSGLTDAYVRVTVSRGEGPGGIGTAGYNQPLLSVLVRPLHPYPPEAYLHGIRSRVVQVRKVPGACLDPTIKCGNYLPNILARRELEAKGMIEGVQLSIDGKVTGGTVSNVFLVNGSRLRTPDLASGILPGITRRALIEVAPTAGLEVVEEQIDVADLYQAEELFFANTLMECLPVGEIDGRQLAPAPGPRTRALQAAFGDLVNRETGAC